MTGQLTDREFLLAVLSDGREHTLNEILLRSFRERGHGLTVHSRAPDLRKRGYVISNRPLPNGGRGSVYQLLSLEPPAALSEGQLAGGSSVDDHAPSPLKRGRSTGDAADTAETSTLAPTLETPATRIRSAGASSVDGPASDRHTTASPSLLAVEPSTLPSQLVLNVPVSERERDLHVTGRTP